MIKSKKDAKEMVERIKKHGDLSYRNRFVGVNGGMVMFCYNAESDSFTKKSQGPNWFDLPEKKTENEVIRHIWENRVEINKNIREGTIG